jgi:serine/threonine-protein kinase
MIGKRVGKYQITEELGRGGMGIVYKATQVTLNRTVALKVLFPHLAKSGEYLARFRREAVTLAKVQHENIVHIYDVEEFEGVSCIVMEYVGGPPLTKVLGVESRLDPARACEIGSALSSALEAAHREGIVHRDIKPDNILFTTHGRPKLTDFGIAHMRDDGIHTRTGMMLGTPYYMSPEQARGRKVTGASDLYSLGVVLYEALSGRVPFDAEDSLAVALMHVNDPPAPLAEIAPWVPPALSQLVHRTLEKDPSNRFVSARDFATALHSVSLAGGRPVPVSPPNATPCPECGSSIRDDFLTCPRCALAIRQRCGECSRLHDPLSPECPFCRTPAMPTPQPVPAAAPRPGPAFSTEAGGGAAPVQDASPTWAGRPPARVAAVVAAARQRLAGAAVPIVENMGEALDRLPPPPTSTAIRRAIDSAWSRLGRPYWAGLPLALWLGIGLLVFALVALVSQAAGDRPQSVAGDGSGGGGGSGAGVFVPPVVNIGPRERQQQEVPAADRERVGEALSSLLNPDSADEATVDSVDEGTADAAEDEARTVSPDDTKVAGDPAADALAAEAAARGAIEAIVERQRVATERGDEEMLLRDLAADLHDQTLENLEDMNASARDITSRVRDISIEFDDADNATVSFHATLTALRRSDGRRVTIHDGRVEWVVARSGGRWLIVAFG